LDDITFHGLRHSFVAIMVAAGCNVREVSEWAGHNSVAFTLTRYGGLFEDSADAAVDRLDALLIARWLVQISDRFPPRNRAGLRNASHAGPTECWSSRRKHSLDHSAHRPELPRERHVALLTLARTHLDESPGPCAWPEHLRRLVAVCGPRLVLVRFPGCRPRDALLSPLQSDATLFCSAGSGGSMWPGKIIETGTVPYRLAYACAQRTAAH
jgi:Phage integrase family